MKQNIIEENLNDLCSAINAYSMQISIIKANDAHFPANYRRADRKYDGSNGAKGLVARNNRYVGWTVA